MEIKTFKYNNGTMEIEIPFDDEIYINATEVYTSFGKKQTSFDSWKTRSLIPYAEKLIELGKITKPHFAVQDDNEVLTLDEVIITRKGGNPQERGVWFHPKLAVVFARWLSMDFEIWCDEKINELLSYYLKAEDLKYVELMVSVIDNYAPNTRTWVKAIRELLTIHEEQGYNIKTFEDLLFQVSKYANQYDRVKLYEKINSVVDDMYKEDILDITTRERMKKACDVRLIALLKTRATKAENKLIKAFTLKEDKGSHDQLVHLTKELETVNAKIISLQESQLGTKIITKTDQGLGLLTLETDEIVTSLRQAINNIAENDYQVFFQQFLIPIKAIEGKNLPHFGSEYVIPGKGRRGAAVWNWETYTYMELSAYDLVGDHTKILSLRLYPLPTDEDVYRGINKDGTICAVYNRPCNCLLIYGIKRILS